MKWFYRVLAFPLMVAIVSLAVDADAGFIGTRRVLLAAGFVIPPDQFVSLTSGSGTISVPAGAVHLRYVIFGAGGGGGSGAREATGGIRTGGGGASAGNESYGIVPVSYFAGSSIPYTVGTGGLGGPAATANSTVGNMGQSGNSSGLGIVPQFQYVGTMGAVATANQPSAVCWDGTDFIEVGTGGFIWTSATGLTGSWTQQTSGTTNNLLGIACNGTTAIAVGVTGTILRGTSHGTTWVTDTSGTTNQLNAVVYDSASTDFVAVGNSGIILYSAGSGTWTANAYSSANNITDIDADGSNKLVAVDNKGQGITATSPSSTFTAAQVTPSSSYGILSITHGGGIWAVITGGTGATSNNNIGATYYATDPTTASWAAGTALPQSVSLKYVNGYFFGINFHANLAIGTSITAPFTYMYMPSNSGGSAIAPEQIAFGAGIWLMSDMGTNPVGTNGNLQAQNVSITSPISLAFTPIVVTGGVAGGGGGTTNATGGPVGGASMLSNAAGAASSSTANLGSGPGGICGSGAAGGSADASNNNRAPGSGGGVVVGPQEFPGGSGGIGGGVGPTAGISTVGSQLFPGPGGSASGGGAFNASTIGQSGGSGAQPCAGGSGGAATDNGTNSGAGGQGGAGEIRLWWQFSLLIPSANDNSPAFLDQAA